MPHVTGITCHKRYRFPLLAKQLCAPVIIRFQSHLSSPFAGRARLELKGKQLASLGHIIDQQVDVKYMDFHNSWIRNPSFTQPTQLSGFLFHTHPNPHLPQDPNTSTPKIVGSPDPRRHLRSFPSKILCLEKISARKLWNPKKIYLLNTLIQRKWTHPPDDDIMKIWRYYISYIYIVLLNSFKTSFDFWAPTNLNYMGCGCTKSLKPPALSASKAASNLWQQLKGVLWKRLEMYKNGCLVGKWRHTW